MKDNISITDFKFCIAGYGHYKVTYTSPVTGKQWAKTINDMDLIDTTKNAEYPKKKDLQSLRRYIKDFGYLVEKT